MNVNESLMQQMIEDIYRQGYEDAMQEYAIWHAGEETIGIAQRPLKEAQAECRQDTSFSVPVWDLKMTFSGGGGNGH